MKQAIFMGVRMETSLKARLEKLALKREKTQGQIIREALSVYLDNYQRGGGISMKKREREEAKERPIDLHDGVMFFDTVYETIEKEKRLIEKRRPLRLFDFDHFIKLVESESKIAKTYEHEEWITKELEELKQVLIKEKNELK